ncbi:MAG: hypothetical protein ACK4XJ_10385 [Fimbriimonadaceae bacterium]
MKDSERLRRFSPDIDGFHNEQAVVVAIRLGRHQAIYPASDFLDLDTLCQRPYDARFRVTGADHLRGLDSKEAASCTRNQPSV